jgi:hypothetical protein
VYNVLRSYYIYYQWYLVMVSREPCNLVPLNQPPHFPYLNSFAKMSIELRRQVIAIYKGEEAAKPVSMFG